MTLHIHGNYTVSHKYFLWRYFSFKCSKISYTIPWDSSQNISKGQQKLLRKTYFLRKIKVGDFLLGRNWDFWKNWQILQFHITFHCDIIFWNNATRLFVHNFETFLNNISTGEHQILTKSPFLMKILMNHFLGHPGIHPVYRKITQN